MHFFHNVSLSCVSVRDNVSLLYLFIKGYGAIITTVINSGRRHWPLTDFWIMSWEIDRSTSCHLPEWYLDVQRCPQVQRFHDVDTSQTPPTHSTCVKVGRVIRSCEVRQTSGQNRKVFMMYRAELDRKTRLLVHTLYSLNADKRVQNGHCVMFSEVAWQSKTQQWHLRGYNIASWHRQDMC